MRTLQERLRVVLQRNTSAVSQGAGPHIPMIDERYRDERGRMITVTASSYLEVTYRYDFYSELCKMPLRQFENGFEKVDV